MNARREKALNQGDELSLYAPHVREDGAVLHLRTDHLGNPFKGAHRRRKNHEVGVLHRLRRSRHDAVYHPEFPGPLEGFPSPSGPGNLVGKFFGFQDPGKRAADESDADYGYVLEMKHCR